MTQSFKCLARAARYRESTENLQESTVLARCKQLHQAITRFCGPAGALFCLTTREMNCPVLSYALVANPDASPDFEFVLSGSQGATAGLMVLCWSLHTSQWRRASLTTRVQWQPRFRAGWTGGVGMRFANWSRQGRGKFLGPVPLIFRCF